MSFEMRQRAVQIQVSSLLSRSSTYESFSKCTITNTDIASQIMSDDGRSSSVSSVKSCNCCTELQDHLYVCYSNLFGQHCGPLSTSKAKARSQRTRNLQTDTSCARKTYGQKRLHSIPGSGKTVMVKCLLRTDIGVGREVGRRGRGIGSLW